MKSTTAQALAFSAVYDKCKFILEALFLFEESLSLQLNKWMSTLVQQKGEEEGGGGHHEELSVLMFHVEVSFPHIFLPILFK